MAGAPSAYTCALDVKLRTTPRMGMAPRVREVCIMVMDGVVCESNFQALQVGVQESAACRILPLEAIFSIWPRHVIPFIADVTSSQDTSIAATWTLAIEAALLVTQAPFASTCRGSCA